MGPAARRCQDAGSLFTEVTQVGIIGVLVTQDEACVR